MKGLDKTLKNLVVIMSLAIAYLPALCVAQTFYGQEEAQRGIYNTSNGNSPALANTGVPNIGVSLYNEFPVSLSYNVQCFWNKARSDVYGSRIGMGV
ncbi:hypothetical protein [Hymenobacter algoricola]|uniref:Uncharacterized protein n=1 Tax=Hymenobacter algoricola TaxID=486267 RepID=A0ABP7NCE4_9BACT